MQSFKEELDLINKIWIAFDILFMLLSKMEI